MTAAAPASDRAEQRLALLRELAEIGMSLCRGVDPATPDVALVFARLARTVRQTLALEARLEQDGLDRARRAAADDLRETRARGAAAKPQARRAVERAIAEADLTHNDAENLFSDLDDYLDEEDDAGFADRPLAEIVARICQDLGVPFDPDPWLDADPSSPPGEAGRGAGRVRGGAGSPPDDRSSRDPAIRPPPDG